MSNWPRFRSAADRGGRSRFNMACERPPPLARVTTAGGLSVRNDKINGRGHAAWDTVLLLFPVTTVYQLLRLRRVDQPCALMRKQRSR